MAVAYNGGGKRETSGEGSAICNKRELGARQWGDVETESTGMSERDKVHGVEGHLLPLRHEGGWRPKTRVGRQESP